MTLPPKLEKLIENWPAKVIAFAAALFLYAYYQLTTIDSRVLTIPLEVRGSSVMEPVGQIDKYVRVTLKGDAAEINRLTREDFSAWIDISREQEDGIIRSRVFLDMSDQVSALKVLNVDISPVEVTVQLEHRLAKYVPLEPVLVGEPAYGYKVQSVTCEPSQVRIIGTESITQNITSLDTDGIFIEGKSGSFTETVLPFTVNRGIEFDEGQFVAVTVDIQPVIAEKEFTGVPLAVLNTNASFEYELQTRRGDMVLSGSLLALERYTSSPVGLFVDGSVLREPGEYRVPVVAGVSNIFSVSLYSPLEVVVVVRSNEVPEEPEMKSETEDLPEGAAE